MSSPVIGAVSPTYGRVGETIQISGQYIGKPTFVIFTTTDAMYSETATTVTWVETPGTADPLDQISVVIPQIGEGKTSMTVNITIVSDNAPSYDLIYPNFTVIQAQTQASYSTDYNRPVANIPKASDYTNLGVFYQDPDSNATTESTDAAGTKTTAASNAAKLTNNLYGFRFLFNPTTFSYGANVNTSVDWSIPNTNNAVVVGTGIGGQISLSILLDRVADMYTMKNKRPSDIIGPPYYPYDLTNEQCENLLRRGTEYDIEYLFRVVNGKPAPTTMLGYNGTSNFKLESSNMGYIAGTPFIFKVHDSLRYRVMLNTLQVSHDLFTKDMVPIRSYLSIGLERLPDFPSTSTQNLDKFTDIAIGIKSTSTNSGVYRP